jgi:phosphoglycerol transferase MdoB-like AlkP superfamily enzyme
MSNTTTNQILNEGSESTSSSFQYMTILMIILAVLLQSSLATLWASINSLQVIMTLTFLNIDFPANAYTVMQVVIKIVIFDILDVLMVEDNIEFSYTNSVSDQLELIGFEG